MYSESGALRYAYEQGILTKETPLISFLYTTHERKECFNDIDKRKCVSSN